MYQMWVALSLCLLLAALGCDGFHQQMCGRALTDTLALLCDSCYYYRDKKYIHTPQDEGGPWDGLEDPEELEQSAAAAAPPFRERLRAASMLGDTFRRMVRGIADECCHKQCSRDELLNYCCAERKKPVYSS